MKSYLSKIEKWIQKKMNQRRVIYKEVFHLKIKIIRIKVFMKTLFLLKKWNNDM